MQSPPIFFYTLTLDFILALLVKVKGFNTIILVTFKYFKTVTFIPRKDIWSVED